MSCKTNQANFKISPTSKLDRYALTSPNFRGTIFTEHYHDIMGSNINTTQLFTPKVEEVKKAELLLRKQIWVLNSRMMNQGKGCPTIHKKMNCYFRQYVGFINSAGHRVIHINFYWDKYTLRSKLKGYSDHRLNFESDYTSVFDGCSYYWSVNIDLTLEKPFDFWVNGVG